MPLYSSSSKAKLAMAHHDLQIVFNEVVRWYDCTIADSYRTKAKQHEYFTSIPQLSKVDYPTVHNTKPSNAVDVYPYIKGTVSFDLKQGLHFGGWVMALANKMHEDGLIKHQIRWGGDWNGDHDINDNPFEDTGHFEIMLNPGETVQYFET
jgi:peptidoglycan L-alanyl-D-glutamate endopeptidase CwlK